MDNGTPCIITCEDGRCRLFTNEADARDWFRRNRYTIIGVTDPDGEDAWDRMVRG